MSQHLDDLLFTYGAKVRELFMDELVGIYLTGSVAFGEFFEGKGDLDFTVLLKSPMGIDKLDKIAEIHQDISFMHKNIPLESQYICVDNIGKSETDTQPFYTWLHDNKLLLGKHNAHAVTWFALKKHGITVAGIPADKLNITTSVQDIKTYVKGNVATYWQDWLNAARTATSSKRLSALSDWGIEWCVCGITRMYFTMMEEDVTAKGKAVEYGLEHLPEHFHKILREALRIRRGVAGKEYASPFIRRRDMLAYMEYLIALIENMPI